MAEKKIIILDQFGHPAEMPKRPDAETQAAVREKVDRWANSVVREITPDVYARVMSLSAPLWEKQALCDRVYYNAHFLAIGADRASTICGWEWEIQPFTDRPGVKAKPDDVKVAEEVAQALYGAQNLAAYFEHLAWGELYFAAAAETIWDTTNYVPVRFELIDGVRLNWWERQLTLLTEASPRTGEPLKPGNWTVHSLNLKNPHKARLPRANSFWHMLTTFGVVDYAALSEKYGKPIPIGYFTDDSQRDALIDALMQIGEEFVGAFPVGTKVELTQALSTANKDVVEGLTKFGYDQSTKATCGHVLIVEAKSGSGTLGGNGAQMTNQKIARGVANRVAESARHGLIRPLVWFRRGQKFLGRLPVLQFKARNIADEVAKAGAYAAWNVVLAPTGLTIDPEHIRETAGVPALVPRVVVGAPPAAAGADPTKTPPAPADGEPATTDAGVATTVNAITGIALDKVHTVLLDIAAHLLSREAAIILIKGAGFSIEDATAMVDSQIADAKTAADQTPADAQPPAGTAAAQQRASRRAAMADRAPKIRTATDLIAASSTLAERGHRERAKKILELAQQALERELDVEEFRAQLWENYDALSTAASAEALTQAMVVADAIGAADAAVRAGQ